MPVKNITPAYQYGLSLLQNQPGPNQAGIAGGLERALLPIMAGLLLRKGEKQQEAKDKDYGEGLLQYQQNVQNELVPTGINPTPPVQMGEDPSLRDYSGVVQRAAPGEAMANALLGVKNPDVIQSLQPMIMQQQMADLARADERGFQTSQNLGQQRFARNQQQGQQEYGTQERLGGQEFAASQTAEQLAAQQAIAAANRDATTNRTNAQIAAQASEGAADRASREEAARIRANVAQTAKPMPQGVQRAEDEDLDAIGLATSLGNDLKTFQDKIASGKLNLGLGTNTASSARNFLGIGNENSRNFADFKATLEKARNDSLRLNKGVQTEGDAVRAWTEIMANLNDEGVVMQRLQAIEGINARAAQLRAQNVDIRRTRNNQPGFDWTGFKVPASPYEAGDGQSALPQGVTEDDISETMRANNMTREQVLQRLGGR